MELDLKSGIQDGIGSEIWNPRWNWILNLESKMELDLKIWIQDGIGFENLESKMELDLKIWNPRWNLDLKSGIQDGIGFEIWNPNGIWRWIWILEIQIFEFGSGFLKNPILNWKWIWIWEILELNFDLNLALILISKWIWRLKISEDFKRTWGFENLKWRIKNKLDLKLEFLKSGDESGISKLNWTLKFNLEYWIEFEIESWKWIWNFKVELNFEIWFELEIEFWI